MRWIETAILVGPPKRFLGSGVRNPTGVSHSPSEQVEDEDAEAGAVADSLEHLLTRATDDS